MSAVAMSHSGKKKKNAESGIKERSNWAKRNEQLIWNDSSQAEDEAAAERIV